MDVSVSLDLVCHSICNYKSVFKIFFSPKGVSALISQKNYHWFSWWHRLRLMFFKFLLLGYSDIPQKSFTTKSNCLWHLFAFDILGNLRYCGTDCWGTCSAKPHSLNLILFSLLADLLWRFAALTSQIFRTMNSVRQIWLVQSMRKGRGQVFWVTVRPSSTAVS